MPRGRARARTVEVDGASRGDPVVIGLTRADRRGMRAGGQGAWRGWGDGALGRGRGGGPGGNAETHGAVRGRFRGFRYLAERNSADRQGSPRSGLRHGCGRDWLNGAALPNLVVRWYYRSSDRAICGIMLAWPSMATPACANTWFRVSAAISVATSTSLMRLSAARRFSA